MRQSDNPPAVNNRPLATPASVRAPYPEHEDNHSAPNTMSPQDSLSSARPHLTRPSYTAAHLTPTAFTSNSTSPDLSTPSHRSNTSLPTSSLHSHATTVRSSPISLSPASPAIARADSPCIHRSRPYIITLTLTPVSIPTTYRHNVAMSLRNTELPPSHHPPGIPSLSANAHGPCMHESWTRRSQGERNPKCGACGSAMVRSGRLHDDPRSGPGCVREGAIRAGRRATGEGARRTVRRHILSQPE
jgi:hypothetical protein